MPKNIARILESSQTRPLTAGELSLLTGYLQNLERRQARPEDVLERRIKELEGKLEDCWRKLRSVDRNEIMD